MIRRGRYLKPSEARRLFGEGAISLAHYYMIPLMGENDTYIRKNERPLRFYNRVKLNVGDRIDVRLSDWERENYLATVIAEYDDYYLVRKDNGCNDTIHKVCEFTTIRVIKRAT